MIVVQRPTPYYTDTHTKGRPILAVFVHDTETNFAATPTRDGSWHYQIDRTGTIYQHVDDRDIAYHVRACDEHWPEWLPRTSGGYNVSAANYHAVGVEFVSGPSDRSAGTPYTDAQYAAWHELVVTLQGLYGPLAVDAHGRVQLDRTDPVAFDYARAGLVFDSTLDGYRYAPEASMLSDEDQLLLDLMHALGANASSVEGWINEIGALNQLVDELRAQLAECQAGHADGCVVTSVAVRFADGSEQVV